MTIVAGKIESFCVNASETIIYAGNNSGEILIIDINKFQILNRFQANYGRIGVISIHAILPYVASLGYDRSITIWEIMSSSELRLISRFSTRDLPVWNDWMDIVDGRAGGHSLAFHPTEKRLVTKSARSALLELCFENDDVTVLQCTRMHISQELVSVAYHNDRQIISGGVGSVILSEGKTIPKSWKLADFNVHCFEPLDEETYLIASDDRRVYKLNIRKDTPEVMGPRITRDDLEQISYNKVSKRAFIAGFDRNVYEIDTDDCTSKGIVFKAPFKMRWIKSLEKKPDELILQCRNGGLYKVSLSQNKILAVIKETPEALWTSAFLQNGNIVLGGDGNSIYQLEKNGLVDAKSRIPCLGFSLLANLGNEKSYTKRLITDQNDNIYIGRTDGDLYLVNDKETTLLINLQSAIRDIAFSATHQQIFAALENGSVAVFCLATREIIATYHADHEEPVWSLAYNEKHHILAIGEYEGAVHLIDLRNGDRLYSFNESVRPKRMKWISDDILLFNRFEDLLKLNYPSLEVSEVVIQQENTIEDFIVDIDNGYLIIIAYTQHITLCDLNSGEILDRCHDQCDYSKGISWVYDREQTGAAYQLDFFTFGRSGECHFFRVLNDAIFSLGFSLGKEAIN